MIVDGIIRFHHSLFCQKLILAYSKLCTFRSSFKILGGILILAFSRFGFFVVFFVGNFVFFGRSLSLNSPD